jgi:beta-lactamase superfamily II metal-dependent hydrolase
MFVFCQADRYQQLFLVDESGEIVSRDIPKVLSAVKCGPDTPRAGLPPNYNAAVILTGDAEADTWNSIRTGHTTLSARIPRTTRFFKVPHHGSRNGLFETGTRNTPWLDALRRDVKLGISSHIRPYSQPSTAVISHLKKHTTGLFRTDVHYHVTVTTNGSRTWVSYSH